MYLLMTSKIHEAVPRSRYEPTLRILWNAVARPRCQCGDKGIGQCVFSGCNIMRARSEQRHEASVRFARYRFDRVMRRLISSSFQR